MLTQKTIIDQVEITRGGVIQVRFALLVLDDAGNELASRWHRMALEPGADVDAAIAAVNDDITTRPTLMAPAVDPAGLAPLKGVVALIHTPALVASYQAAKNAALAKALAPAVPAA